MDTEAEVTTRRSRAAADVAAMVASAGHARAKAAAAELAAMRHALNAAAQSIEQLLATPLPVEGEVTALVDRLAKQFQDAQSPDATIQTLRAQVEERDRQNEELRTLLVKARMELEAARADLAAERERADAEGAHAAQLTGAFDRALDDLRSEHATIMAEQSAACTTLPLDELLTVFNAMRKAETTPELHAALLAGLAREFSRVALFHVNGSRLVAAERIGFEDTDTSKPIRLPQDSFLTRAVMTARLESVIPTLPGEPGTTLPFGGTPSCAVAIPLVHQGTTTAVVYADDSDHVEFATSVPQVRIKFAELLQQYALLVQVRISVERKSTDDLRGLAATLVAELECLYSGEAEAGRSRLECQHRLKEALQEARSRFAERAKDAADAAGLFDEQLSATMIAKHDTAFGRDLTALLGGSSPRGKKIVAMFK